MIMAATTQAQENPKSPPPVTPDRPAATRNPHGQLGAIGKVFIGDLAPDFELDGSHGVPVKLSRLRGDWLLLVFADRERLNRRPATRRLARLFREATESGGGGRVPEGSTGPVPAE